MDTQVAFLHIPPYPLQNPPNILLIPPYSSPYLPIPSNPSLSLFIPPHPYSSLSIPLYPYLIDPEHQRLSAVSHGLPLLQDLLLRVLPQLVLIRLV